MARNYDQPTKYKLEILKLKKDGYDYKEIAKKVGCSVKTSRYWCDTKYRDKIIKRDKEYRKRNKEKISKIQSSYYRKSGLHHALYRKVYNFHVDQTLYKTNKSVTLEKQGIELSFTIDDVKKLFKAQGGRCALTNKKLVLKNTTEWQLDHMIPRTRGGDNSISNCQILSKEANAAKWNMTNSEFIKLCKKVIKHCK